MTTQTQTVGKENYVVIEHNGNNVEFYTKPYQGRFFDTRTRIEKDGLRMATFPEIVSLLYEANLAPERFPHSKRDDRTCREKVLFEIAKCLNHNGVFGNSAVHYFHFKGRIDPQSAEILRASGREIVLKEKAFFQEDASDITPRTSETYKTFCKKYPSAPEIDSQIRTASFYYTRDIDPTFYPSYNPEFGCPESSGEYNQTRVEHDADTSLVSLAGGMSGYKKLENLSGRRNIYVSSAIVNSVYTESGSFFIPFLRKVERPIHGSYEMSNDLEIGLGKIIEKGFNFDEVYIHGDIIPHGFAFGVKPEKK